jgi:N-acetylglucosaminyldiphosphoundecaprenol N-acetyl-beta-D-mannosaminyltransferase
MNNHDSHKKSLLGIGLPTASQEDTLEKTIKFIKNPHGNFFVMSLNPEIFVEMEKNYEFKEVVREAQLKLVDGTGVVLAARLQGIPVGDRFTGVDFMDRLICHSALESLSVMLIGGKEKVAETLVDCYQKEYPNLDIFGLQGIKHIQNPSRNEEDKIFSIVADRKPHIIFLAFGSPAQELWLMKHKNKLQGIVCAGVGGAFDFLAGKVPRAPGFVRKIGLEWMYRLIQEPWRWRRQLRLFTFIRLVAQDALQKDKSQ